MGGCPLQETKPVLIQMIGQEQGATLLLWVIIRIRHVTRLESVLPKLCKTLNFVHNILQHIFVPNLKQQIYERSTFFYWRTYLSRVQDGAMSLTWG